MAVNEDAYYRNKKQGYHFFKPDSYASTYINAPRLSRDAFGVSIDRNEFSAAHKVRIFFIGLSAFIVALLLIGLF